MERPCDKAFHLTVARITLIGNGMYDQTERRYSDPDRYLLKIASD